MRAPWSTAQTMPAAMMESRPDPFESRTFTGITEQFQQMPATPARLLARAPMIPATGVP